MKFRRAFPLIFQEILEVDPFEVTIRVSKPDIIDTYHRGIIQMSHVGAFSYVIPSEPGDEGCIICIDLVLPMGWVDSPTFSECSRRH